MPDHAALLAHIVSQTRANVEFLMAHGELSRPDGAAILQRLPAAGDAAVRELSNHTARLGLGAAPAAPSFGASMPVVTTPSAPPPPPPAAAPVAAPGPRLQQAKAIWAYNEDGSEPNDLSFRTGDVIEIVAETNADWWTGRHNGREGLFPSNYVEKLSSSAAPPSYPPPNDRTYSAPAAPINNYNQSNYSSPPPPQHGYGSPPPQPYGGQVQPYGGYQQQVQAPPPPQQQVAVQQEQPKKSRFGGGGLGNLLATSAVGGVGFGAGSAVGSGIVNAIF